MTTYYKRNDTRPVLELALTEDGQPFDLTDVTDVAVFLVNTDNGGQPIETTAEIKQPPTGGILELTFTQPDTAASGTYNVEAELTYQDGGVETVPNHGYMSLTIEDDLA